MRGIGRTLGPFPESCRWRADEPGSLEGTRDALATLVLLDDRRLSGGARGGMFRVVHEDALAVMAIGRAVDGSGHPATDQATENGAWGLPSLVLRSGALSPAPHAQPRLAGRRLDALRNERHECGRSKKERRAPAPPCNLEPLAVGCSKHPARSARRPDLRIKSFQRRPPHGSRPGERCSHALAWHMGQVGSGPRGRPAAIARGWASRMFCGITGRSRSAAARASCTSDPRAGSAPSPRRPR